MTRAEDAATALEIAENWETALVEAISTHERVLALIRRDWWLAEAVRLDR